MGWLRNDRAITACPLARHGPVTRTQPNRTSRSRTAPSIKDPARPSKPKPSRPCPRSRPQLPASLESGIANLRHEAHAMTSRDFGTPTALNRRIHDQSFHCSHRTADAAACVVTLGCDGAHGPSRRAATAHTRHLPYTRRKPREERNRRTRHRAGRRSKRTGKPRRPASRRAPTAPPAPPTRAPPVLMRPPGALGSWASGPSESR